jgi:hypothetical protein
MLIQKAARPDWIIACQLLLTDFCNEIDHKRTCNVAARARALIFGEPMVSRSPVIMIVGKCRLT